MRPYPLRKRVSSLVLALSVLMAFAGPAGSATASAAETDGIETLPFEAISKDGTVLRGHVHLPTGRGSLGTVLSFSPYWNNELIYGPTEVLGLDAATFTDAGFAYAAVNIRGTGLSGGCVQYGTKLDRQDAYAVVETLARQQWSNGKVGMFGLSYDGFMQFAAMAADPPSLKAVVPMSGWTDVWSWLTSTGAPYTFSLYFMPMWRPFFFGTPTSPSIAGHPNCPDLIMDDAEVAAEFVRSGDRTDYFDERDLRPLLRDSDVPAWIVNGSPLRDNLDFDDYWRYLEPKNTRLLLGTWGHEYPINAPHDFMTSAVDWFDHYLRGGPEKVRTGVFEIQDDANAWHRVGVWPPPTISTPRVFLSKNKLVSSRSSVESSTASFQAIHTDPGRTCPPQSTRQPQALFVSQPLSDTAVLAGSFRLRTELTSSLVGGNLTAILYRTVGDGSCADVSAHGTEIGRIQLDLRHWKTPGRGRDFPVNATEVTLRSEPFVGAIKPGQRLVLAVGGGSDQIAPDPLLPSFTIRTGAEIAGFLELPLIKGRIALEKK